MNFLEGANLAWAALIPVLVLFYFMKLRRREVAVTAAFLWQRAAQQARVDSFFQRLKLNLLLLLQLLALAALILALARPFTVAPGRSSDQLALVVDTSASMQAQGRFEQARQKALEVVRRAPRGAEFMVVAAGAQLRVVLPFTQDRDRVRQALERLSPEDVAGNLEGLSGLVLSTVSSKPRAEVFLFGDQLPEGTLHPRFRFFGFGAQVPNLAVASFNVTRERDKLLVFAAVESHAEAVETRTATVRRGGRVVYSRPLQVPAGGRRTLLLSQPADGPDDFEFELSPHDALEADDRAYAVVPLERRVKVAVIGKNSFAERALLAVEGVELFRLEHLEPGFDLVLWCAGVEPTGPGVGLVLGLPKEWGGKPHKGRQTLTGSDHPLMAGLPWDQVAVGDTTAVTVPQGCQTLARAGQDPALILRRSQGQTTLFVGFDLYRSNLPLSPLLPILMARFIETEVRPFRAAVPDQALTGAGLSIRAPGQVEVTNPEGHHFQVADGLFLETSRSGFYRIDFEGQSRRVAVNLFSSQESTLLEAPEDVLGVATENAASTRSLAQEWWWQLVALGLLVLVGEWLLFHRREGL
ncbi:MAG: BatA domain-containing protein [Vulcanimicrobiota bacterium]